nr:hypothetical protein [Tanacetum cinerariifolium]
MMADNRTMKEMIQAPTEGCGDAIVVPDILAENFKIKTGLLSLIQANQFHGFESNNPHDHIRSFNRITSTLKFKDVPNDAINLMLFLYSLEGAAKIWITSTLKFKDVPNDAINLMLFPYSLEGAAKICRSGVTLAGPSISPPLPSKEVDREPETITDQVLTGSTNNVPPPVVQLYHASTSSTPISFPKMPEVTKDTVQPSTENIQPSVAQTQVSIDEPVVAPKPKPTIPYPSRANKQKLCEKDDNLALKFVEIFRNLHFELSFADALLHMPKFALMFKRDPDKFLIPCDFSELDECLATAGLGASINLMHLSIWRKLSLAELTSTQMILELADRSTTQPVGIVEDAFVKVRKFHFPTNFVVIDYVVEPCIPLILGRPFLRTERALIDVYACEEYVQEVLGFSDNSKSGSPTLILDPIISTSFPSFTPFEGSDFILEEIETFLRTPDELSNLDDDYYDMEGDILYLEKLLNEDPSSNLPLVKTEDLKQVDATTTKPSIEEPPKLELKELPSHLEYAFLEGTDKLPVIISKELNNEEKSAL